jgi:DNA repair ATPase RecN
MKLKLLLMLIFYGSSVYALQTAYWDNFLKSFNDFKHQMAKTCEAKEALSKKNNELGEKKLLMSESESIKPALWTVQKSKAKVDKKLDRIDDIAANDLVNALLEIQGKEKKGIEPALQDLAENYFDNLIVSIKKAKILTQSYNELMSAPDDAPPSLSRQISTLKEKVLYKKTPPQGIQVSVSWKKNAERMMKTECKEAPCHESNCERFFEFREGAALYYAEHPTADIYPSGIQIYAEMKKSAIKLLEENKTLKKNLEDFEVKKSEQKTLQANYDKCLADLTARGEKLIQLNQKAKTLKSAVDVAVDALKDPAADGRVLLNDLKKTMDGIFPPKPAPTKP